MIKSATNSATKVALVTGAGSGIGRAVTLGLFFAGYAVVLAGRHLKTLQETISQAGGPNERLLAIATDVANPDQVCNLFSQLETAFHRLDLLFNNAGVATLGVPIDELPYDQWCAAVDVNLTGAFLCAQQTIRLMKRQNPRGGRIINNGSISAISPRPNSAPYTATKHAITGLTKSISLDGRAFDIACGQIDIGNAATDMTSKMSTGAKQADGSVQPEPLMDVKHVTDAVLYMAGLPLDANVQFMTLMATNMPLIGRG